MTRLRIDRLTPAPAPLRHRGVVLAARCHLATTAVARLVGLLGTVDLDREEALWLPRCSAVHAIGLRAPIGCAFLDSGGRVLRVVDPLPRGRTAATRHARHVVECRAGVLATVVAGDLLVRDEYPAPSVHQVIGGG